MSKSSIGRSPDHAAAPVGSPRWPKLFQNLRSTRETELADEFSMHVVCQWIGNSQPIAAKHYLQVTDEHFEKAVRLGVQQPAVLPRTGTQAGLVPQQVSESTQDRTFALAGSTG